VDYRSQPREYRSAAYKWLEELKKDNRLVGDIVLRRSYLEDCRGERLVIMNDGFICSDFDLTLAILLIRIEKIMMALSTLVLKTTMERKQEFSDGMIHNIGHFQMIVLANLILQNQ
jgi:hypothetical protein